jgi:hypothetical protein
MWVAHNAAAKLQEQQLCTIMQAATWGNEADYSCHAPHNSMLQQQQQQQQPIRQQK